MITHPFGRKRCNDARVNLLELLDIVFDDKAAETWFGLIRLGWRRIVRMQEGYRVILNIVEIFLIMRGEHLADEGELVVVVVVVVFFFFFFRRCVTPDLILIQTVFLCGALLLLLLLLLPNQNYLPQKLVYIASQ